MELVDHRIRCTVGSGEQLISGLRIPWYEDDGITTGTLLSKRVINRADLLPRFT
jgi:hypothetical protein